MLLTPRLLFRSTTSKMAPPSASKMIFAPTSSPSTTVAEQFTMSSLSRSDLSPSPITQFHAWFQKAQSSSVPHPETVCLSTASLPSGRVSARMVYMKELDSKGFVIYSNFGTSKKAADIETNRWASLTFWWKELERQVRVEGTVERLSDAESQVYFDTRVRGSRIGAWASRQSQVIDDDRQELDGWVKDVEDRFEGEEGIPVPTFWGGLRVKPVEVEFWQGRESRLHDRFVYRKVEDSSQDGKGVADSEWTIERLSP